MNITYDGSGSQYNETGAFHVNFTVTPDVFSSGASKGYVIYFPCPIVLSLLF